MFEAKRIWELQSRYAATIKCMKPFFFYHFLLIILHPVQKLWQTSNFRCYMKTIYIYEHLYLYKGLIWTYLYKLYSEISL